ncbi:MAG TPA: extracellular solute-binding protein [Galbitalea sp.]|nr:extracellular solute-binding protein [Galbitalea sp.]
MKSPRKSIILAVAGVAAAGMVLSGCSSSGGSSNGKIEIVVASVQPGASADALAAFQTQVKTFEKKNPDITVKGEEYDWTGPTFAAQLAGGTLPDEFGVPFTDSRTLANNGQLANLSQWIKKLPYYSKFNKNVLNVAEDSKGNIYGIPFSPYAMAISYNRADFTKAGLDPNKPPTTWDEVESDAKAISKALPGVAGYMQMTSGNTGGWELTSAAYTRGGRVETTAANGKITVDTDIPAIKDSLAYLHQIRWVDNAAGSNFLLDWNGINTAFGSGKVAMYMSGSDVLSSLVQNDGVDPSNYGVTTIPMTSDANAGVLSGGTVAVGNAKDSPAQLAAVVKWIDFYYGQPAVNKAAAVTQAKALQASKQVVGAPALPIFNAAQAALARSWIKPYATPDVFQNVAPFTDNIGNQPIVGEPGRYTQDLYGALDSVVQAVLTQKNPDVDALLKAVNVKIQAEVDADADQAALK